MENRKKMQSLFEKRLLLFVIGFCCLSAASASLIPPQSQKLYRLENKISIHELTKPSSNGDESSFTFSSELIVNSVWDGEDNAQLLQVYFTKNKISAPGKGTKNVITRDITKIPDRPFYISLVDGKPQKVIAHTSRDQSLLNLERAIASLLQLQYADGPVHELDVSGRCQAFYSVKSSTNIEKTKTDCSHWDLRVNYRSEKPLSVSHKSKQQINFKLSAENLLLRAESVETHRLSLEAKPDIGSEIISILKLKHVEDRQTENVEQLAYETLEKAIESLLEWYRVFDIEADVDGAISELKDKTLKEVLAENVVHLGTENVGKSILALQFTQLLPLARITSQTEFVDILRNAEKAILPQLVDLLGAVQTNDAHNAIHEVFQYDNASNSELLEKYLQSLAVGTHPDRAIIKHLLQILTQTEPTIKNKKLRDTLTQTVAALTYQSGFEQNDALLQQVMTYVLNGLKECQTKDSVCKTLYIRALQNLRDPRTISTLFEIALTADTKVSVAALQTLKSFPLVNFNEHHRQIFSQIFYQRQRKFDSSARMLALDVLLSLKPTPDQLGQLLDYLSSQDRHFEVKTYVIQKLRMLAERCPRFNALLAAGLSERPNVNNYHVMGQKGLTTALARQLSTTPSFNESLLSIQEVYQGILKRGSVEFILNAGRSETSIFKLGLYTNGLGGIVGDSDSDDSDLPADDDTDEDSVVTAGMEIAVQGIQLRPLVFFEGQTELMSHVWSGTASESTPAYQATTLAQDQEQFIVLASGVTVHMRVLGARSVDLNGKVNFSLWNRNAQTEIQQNSGSAVVGHIVAGFTYAKIVNDFTVIHEPKLKLQADLDFYSNIKLCMQLQRPELILTHKNRKSVFLQAVQKPYRKHISKVHTHKSPGLTLALNQKNNDMCNLIFD